MCADMCAGMCTGMCIEMCRDMCMDAFMDLSAGMCIVMCTGMCADMCVSACVSACVSTCVQQQHEPRRDGGSPPPTYVHSGTRYLKRRRTVCQAAGDSVLRAGGLHIKQWRRYVKWTVG